MHSELAAILTECAIDPTWAAGVGVREATTVADLPVHAAHFGEDALPALVFPWRTINGELVEQVKPLNPVVNGSGVPSKYLWPSGRGSVVNVLKPVAEPSLVVVVEGTKQTLAVLANAPVDWLVVGIGGCSSWTTDGAADGDLGVLVDGRDVVILLDADLDRNLDVFTAAKKLGEVCESFGATSVKWASAPGRGTAGIDDALGRLPDGKRASVLERVVGNAKKKLPPKPRAKAAVDRIDWMSLRTGSRPIVDVEDDRMMLSEFVVGKVLDKWDGTELFMFGGSLAMVDNGAANMVSAETFTHLLHRVVRPQRFVPMRGLVDAALDGTTRMIARDMADRSASPLDGIATAPFVREDGSVCTQVGYDKASRVILTPSHGLGDVVVPDEPTTDEVEQAVKLLLDEWLGDFPFKSQADRANCLGLVLTPFIRGQVGIVPLAIIDGLGPGVGKGLLAEIISVLAVGEASRPMALPSSRDEAWKALHSYAGEGHSFLFIDEAHVLEGEALAAAITAPVITSRILGVSKIGAYPNRMTWVAAGNQVRTRGDLFRRVYQVRLEPSRGGWENRSKNDFRHPNLAAWTRANRAELMSAALTLVRSWFANGKPDAEGQDFGFGSFEDWQQIVAGVVANAGVDGFLGNMNDFRESAAEDRALWRQHLEALRRKYGGSDFPVKAVRGDVMRDEYADPIGGEGSPDPLKEGTKWSYALGNHYKKHKDQPFGDLVMRKSEQYGHGHVVKWFVEQLPWGEGGQGGQFSARIRVRTLSGNVRTHEEAAEQLPPLPPSPQASKPLAFDLETKGVEHLFARDPDFVRIAHSTEGSGVQHILDAVASGRPIAAHNGFGFDFHALGIDVAACADAGLLIDTMTLGLLDRPPMGRLNARRTMKDYGAASLAERYGIPGKTGDIKAMAKKHGGFDAIPLDDEEYNTYCRADADIVEAMLGLIPMSDYAKREMRLMGRLAAGITGSGFRVDVPLLESRIAEGESRRAGYLEELRHLGLPEGGRSPQSTKEGKAAIVAAFQALGVEVPLTDKGNPSLGKEGVGAMVLEGAAAELQATVLGLNGIRTIYQTVDDNRTGDRVHPSVLPLQASGRFSVQDPGLTVFGKRGGKHVERAVLLPDEGCLLVAFDLNQVDARAVAAHSQDHAYMDLFLPGVDSHQEVADMLGLTRDEAKMVSHAWNYGSGVRNIVERTGLSVEVVQTFDQGMRERFPRLVQWRQEMYERGAAGELLDNGFGRMLKVEPEFAYTQAAAYMGQSTARDLISEGVLALPLDIARMIRAFVHDEIVLSIPEGDVDDVVRQTMDALQFSWAPNDSDRFIEVTAGASKPGRSWAECYAK